MYKLLSVNTTGLFSYGIQKTISLDDQGSVLLDGINLDRNGGSNGAGKSGMFHAIVHILYGKNPTGEGADDIINEFIGKYFGQITLLDENDRKWRISDVRKWRKVDKYPDEHFDGYIDEPSEIHNLGLRLSGTDVYLEAWDDTSGMWIDERSSNREAGVVRLDLKATRKKIVDILRMDYDQFTSVAYLAQQQTLKFISGTHKDKLQVLAELSDLKSWDARIIKVREDISNIESERMRLESNLSGLGQIVFTKPDVEHKQKMLKSLDILTTQINACDTEICNINIRSLAWKARCDHLIKELDKTTQNIKDAQKRQADIQSKLDACSRKFSDDCLAIRNTPRPYDATRIETEISESNGQIIARRFDLEQLLVGSGRCPRCRSNVSMDHILRHRELLSLDIKALEDGISHNRELLSKFILEWEVDVKIRLHARASENEQNKKQLDTLLTLYSSQLDVFISRFNEIKTQEKELGADPTTEIYGVEQRRLSIATQIAMAKMQLETWEAQLKKYDEYESMLISTRAKINDIDYRLKHLNVLDRLFGDKGIKSFKLDNILNILNQSLDVYINIITDGSVKVWVSQYRKKTDGDMASDLHIIVREGHKHEVPLALYSGGERQQITLAFIGAFWDLASKCSAGVNIMCLDEVFANLDTSNSQLVFDFLEHLRQNGKSSIFTITHNAEIKDAIHFDQVWTVTKQNGISTLNLNKKL